MQPAKILEVIGTEVIELNGRDGKDGEHLLNSHEEGKTRGVEAPETSKSHYQHQWQGSGSDFKEDSQNSPILTGEKTFGFNHNEKTVDKPKVAKCQRI